jgi:lipopolysaccharide export system permease protein
MRFSRTVFFYVLREVVIYTLVGLAAVSLVFIGTNLARRLTDFLMVGVALRDVLTIVKAVVVVTLAYTVPVSFLFGSLMGISRMSADGEILALRACGVGLKEVVLPVFVVGFAVSCLSWYIVFEVEHAAKRDLRDMVVSMATSGRMIEERRFRQIGNRMFYVESRDRDNHLRGVFISDQSNPERPLLIFAESGDFSFDADTKLVKLALRDGDLHAEGENGAAHDYYRMSFQEFEYVFPVYVPDSLAFHRLRPRDMTTEQLRGVLAYARAGNSIEDLWVTEIGHYEVQLHRRFALPVAPMLFALLVVPLSLSRARGARAWSVLLCGMLMAVYYGVLSFSQYLAVEGLLPAVVALWLPNALLAVTAAVLLHRLGRLPA